MPRNTSGLKASVESRRARLTFGSKASYSITELESGKYTDAELRKEYSRLRGIVNKRIDRLEQSEYLTKEGKVPYNLRKEYYPTLKEIDDRSQLIIKLRELATVVESRRSRIYGLEDIREESVKTLEAKGVSWIREYNWKDFGEFMRDARAMSIGRMFDSDRAVDMFAESVYGGFNADALRSAFDEWLQMQDAKVNAIPEVKR